MVVKVLHTGYFDFVYVMCIFIISFYIIQIKDLEKGKSQFSFIVVGVQARTMDLDNLANLVQ